MRERLFIHSVGLGLLPVPGERRRWRRARQEVEREDAILEQLVQNNIGDSDRLASSNPVRASGKSDATFKNESRAESIDPPSRSLPSAPAVRLDYRGVLDIKEPPVQLNGEFPLGRYISPTQGGWQNVGIDASAVLHNTCVVGPSGVGKTHLVIVPWIVSAIRSGFSVVCVDVKGDLLDSIREWSRSHVDQHRVPVRTQIGVFDYGRADQSIQWSWVVDALDSDRGIDNAVTSILGRQAPRNSDPYFFHMDTNILRGLLELVVESSDRTNMTASTLLSLLQDQQALGRMISSHPENPGRRRLADLLDLTPIEYAKRVAGVSSQLDRLAIAGLDSVTREATFTMNDLLIEQGLVSVVARAADGILARMVAALFVNNLLLQAMNRFADLPNRPLLLVLDEAAWLADRIDFKSLLSVARGAGIAILLAVQDVTQFTDDEERSIIFQSVDNFVSFSGVSRHSAGLFSERLGMRRTVDDDSGISAGEITGQATKTTSTVAPVLGVPEIMHIPFGDVPAIVHARNVVNEPFLVDLADV